MLTIGVLFKLYIKDKEKILDALMEMGVRSEEIQINKLESTAQYSKIDFILCFGGDGTILRSLEYSIAYNAPVLGVNLGKLGFLSDTSLKELKQSIQFLINKKYCLESRMLLDVHVIREKKEIFRGLALNEAVLFKACNSKLINIKLYSNRHFVYETRSDGIVISTPTGSTAYSMSAGGPIISPAMQAIVATPLNPHILTIRPIIFAENDVLCLESPIEQQMYLQTDGKSRCELHKSDKIIIKKASQTIKFVKLTQKTFYRILRKKLQMGKI